MATFAEVKKQLDDARKTQGFKKQYDFTRSFVALANRADSIAIPLPTEGSFIETEYNIEYSKNSTFTPNNSEGLPIEAEKTAVNLCKLKMRSQADNASQSNDYIPVGLISTPGDGSKARYGARPFFHVYRANDSLIIDYDNRAPSDENITKLGTFDVKNETISIVIKGWLFINQ